MITLILPYIVFNKEQCDLAAEIFRDVHVPIHNLESNISVRLPTVFPAVIGALETGE